MDGVARTQLHGWTDPRETLSYTPGGAVDVRQGVRDESSAHSRDKESKQDMFGASWGSA